MAPTSIAFDCDATSIVIVEEIRDAVHPLNQYSEDEDEISKVIAYSLLALLWERDAPEDNIDYQTLSEPADLGYDDPLVIEAFYREQERVCGLIWNLVKEIIRFYGIPQTAEALIENTEMFPPATIIAERWREAEREYGMHPKGLALTMDIETKDYVLLLDAA